MPCWRLCAWLRQRGAGVAERLAALYAWLEEGNWRNNFPPDQRQEAAALRELLDDFTPPGAAGGPWGLLRLWLAVLGDGETATPGWLVHLDEIWWLAWDAGLAPRGDELVRAVADWQAAATPESCKKTHDAAYHLQQELRQAQHDWPAERRRRELQDRLRLFSKCVPASGL